MNSEDLPPPAYSEQEFDQKISTALDVSLTVSQPAAVQASEEVWEEWNEAVYEAATRKIPRKHRLNSSWPNQIEMGSPSHSQHAEDIGARSLMRASIEPLRIHKKSASVGKLGLSKTYFDGYQEDISGEVFTHTSQANGLADMAYQRGVDPPTLKQTLPTTQTIHHNAPLVEEHDFASPPPPFSPAEPNPDGTPIVIMSYNPSTSPPPSPLISPSLAHSPLPDHRRQPPQVQLQPPYAQQTSTTHEGFVPHYRPPRQSLPTPPRSSNNRLGKHPATSLGANSMQASRDPRMDFNPSVAYNKQGVCPLPLTPAQPHMQPFSANAFYNSAVSAHLPNLHTTPAVSCYDIGQQLPRTSYHPSSSYDHDTEQIRQQNFYGSQHAALPVRGGAIGVNHEYQNRPSYTTPQHPAHPHR